MQVESVCTQEEVNNLREKIAELELLLFAVVRNRAVAPAFHRLGKSEAEITAMTLETIESLKLLIDYPKVRELMKLKEGGKKDE